jgi:hypothetical protein
MKQPQRYDDLLDGIEMYDEGNFVLYTDYLDLLDRYNKLANPTPPKRATDASFSEFWAIYPKKKAKGDARKAWNKACKHADAIMEALPQHLASEQWQDPTFIPYPATWLRAEQWHDEIDDSKPKPDFAEMANRSFCDNLARKENK